MPLDLNLVAGEGLTAALRAAFASGVAASPPPVSANPRSASRCPSEVQIL